MKKKIIYSFILTCILIFGPAFMVSLDEEAKETVKVDNLDKNNVTSSSAISESKKDHLTDEITTFSSSTCFKKTYYIALDKVNVYEDDSGRDKVLFTLGKDDVVVAYKESKGYVYCEENKQGKKGWIKKNKNDLKGMIYKQTQYALDVNLKEQNMSISKNNKIIKKIPCSTGLIGDQDTETPLGVFYVQSKGEYFYSNKYNEGARYYIKFFSNYLIHSIPVNEKGNIIEDERKKLGFPASHGCIRISIQDAEWIYKNIPEGSSILIHY